VIKLNEHAASVASACMRIGVPLPLDSSYLEILDRIKVCIASTDPSARPSAGLLLGLETKAPAEIMRLLVNRIKAEMARDDRDWTGYNASEVGPTVARIRARGDAKNAEWGTTEFAYQAAADRQREEHEWLQRKLRELISELPDAESLAGKLAGATFASPAASDDALWKTVKSSATPFVDSLTFDALPPDTQAGLLRMERFNTVGVSLLSHFEKHFGAGFAKFITAADETVDKVPKFVLPILLPKDHARCMKATLVYQKEVVGHMGDALVKEWYDEVVHGAPAALAQLPEAVTAQLTTESDADAANRLQLLSDLATICDVMRFIGTLGTVCAL
jgi:hypothetical protein